MKDADVTNYCKDIYPWFQEKQTDGFSYTQKQNKTI